MTKKQVTILAVTARLNRKLRKENLKLVKNSPRWESTYGTYMTVHLGSNMIDRYPLDLEDLAREYECLADYERIEE